ncbi:MAG: family 16 glycosylhydrolase [candidate division KSB1 bacterium]|nr:family 16 glycosylhydrolase [candidate division KSB1 bacterium]
MSKFCGQVFIFLVLPAWFCLAKDYKGAEYRTKEAFLYGRFEVRYKPPKGDGFLASFFTYHEITSTSAWNEIDFEILGRYDHDVQVTSIGPGQMIRNSHQWLPFNTHEDFHDYAFEWTPDYIAWFVDGQEIYRQDQAHIADFKYEQKIMMNIWPPSWEPWAGKLDERALPVFACYDWVSYASYTPGSGNMGTNNNFTLQWKDDFNDWDQARWEKATHTFGGNNCDFMPENAVFKDGYLILCLTKASPLGNVDTSPPAVQWTRAHEDKIVIGFSEDLDPASAQKTSSYVISGVTIQAATLLADRRTVELAVAGLDVSQAYQMIVMGVKDNSAAHNMLAGQVIPLTIASPLSFPVKINVGGPAYRDYLADQVWSPELEYGHQDGYEDKWLGQFEIQSTDEDTVYLTALHELVTYRVRVPNGRYKVTLMFAENQFNEAGRRIFDVIVEANRVASKLDLYQQVGAHNAYEIVVDSVDVTDEMIDIHFTNRWNFSLLNGLVIERLGASAMHDQGQVLPRQSFLAQNYPNPFNAMTIIRFGLITAGPVKLELYNLLGQRIKVLIDEIKPAGNFEVQLDGQEFASGIYLCHLQAGQFLATRKLLLMK